MTNKPIYTCSETCGQEKHCGNRYCSAHPEHFKKKQGGSNKRMSDGSGRNSHR